MPLHKKLDAGLLRSLIRDAGISVDEFLEMLYTKVRKLCALRVLCG
ncbi:MAG: hypothetical protein R3F46_11455 [bacterium]